MIPIYDLSAEVGGFLKKGHRSTQAVGSLKFSNPPL